MEEITAEPLSTSQLEEIHKTLKDSDWVVGYLTVLKIEGLTTKIKSVVWGKIRELFLTIAEFEANEEFILKLQIKSLSFQDKAILQTYEKNKNQQMNNNNINEVRRSARNIIDR